MRSVSPSLVLAGTLATGASAIAGAAEPVNPFEEPDEALLFQVEEELVTVASRYAQTAEQAPSIVTVLTDRDIRSRGYRTLADLLRSLPGVFVTVSPEGRQARSGSGGGEPRQQQVPFAGRRRSLVRRNLCPRLD